ncbi:MAG: hypothetical protein WAN77_08710 [Thermoplasmata archaeon]
MSPVPAAVLRSLESLAEESGRTIVIAGPSISGKSALLEEIRAMLKAGNVRRIELRGNYRNRTIPFGALDGLEEPMAYSEGEPGGPSEEEEEPPPDWSEEDLGKTGLPVAYVPDRPPQMRRSRGERPRTMFLGQPVRGRAAREADANVFWQNLVQQFRSEHASPIAMLVEDGCLFDSQSREFVLAISARARLRPLLCVIVLDTTVSTYVAWEDQLSGRGDVDWIRIAQPKLDPREAHRLKVTFDQLPDTTRRIIGYVALMGGVVAEVALSRVAKLKFAQITELLLPAVNANILKIQDGKVQIPHLAWTQLIPELTPEKDRKAMHLEIAEGLAALSPESNLAREIEIGRHFFAWSPGPMALRHLLVAGELSIQANQFDQAEELLAQAIICIPSLPPAEQMAKDAEVRLLHAQALFMSGRPSEGEDELREGVNRALQGNVASSQLEGWIEPLVLVLRAVGPRPSLEAELQELSDRCHAAATIPAEILVDTILTTLEFDRSRPRMARQESRRAATLARNLDEESVQALALLSVAIARIEGSPEEQQQAADFLKASRILLAEARRHELEQLVEHLEALLLTEEGDLEHALEIRRRQAPIVHRMKLLSLEIAHQLGIARLSLDLDQEKGIGPALSRARVLVETLRLLPPSPLLLEAWMLEGRKAALDEAYDVARDRWLVLIDLPAPQNQPRFKAEAMVRLAFLEYATDHAEAGKAYLDRLWSPEMFDAVPMRWKTWLGDLERFVPESGAGGAALPTAPYSPSKTGGAQHGKRLRRQPVQDRQGSHDK